MADGLIKKIGRTELIVVRGDITQTETIAIMTAINPQGWWFGGVDKAIERTAGNYYHDQARKKMPLKDGQIIVAKGDGYKHRGKFKDVIFVVDNYEQPLSNIIYAGLKAAHDNDYKTIAVPAMRMGVAAGEFEKTPQETVKKFGEGILCFMKDKAYETPLKKITIVVYNDERAMHFLETGLNMLDARSEN